MQRDFLCVDPSVKENLYGPGSDT